MLPLLPSSMTLVSTALGSVTKLDAWPSQVRGARGDHGEPAPAVPVATVHLASGSVLVVTAGPGVALDRARLVELLRDAHPSTPVVFAVSSRPGSVSAEVVGQLDATSVAAAAAVVQASWAWDESDPIHV